MYPNPVRSRIDRHSAEEATRANLNHDHLVLPLAHHVGKLAVPAEGYVVWVGSDANPCRQPSFTEIKDRDIPGSVVGNPDLTAVGSDRQVMRRRPSQDLSDHLPARDIHDQHRTGAP